MAIVCDLCGGSSFVKEGDFYVCQGCGTKYSLEEAKRMLTSEVSADNKNAENAVLNYMTLGQNAIKAGNLSEAESYANKALEVDSVNSQAWILKGKAVGWQSTLEESRIDEAISYFSAAINYASDEERQNVIVTSYNEICTLLIAVINLRGENYAKSGGTMYYQQVVDGAYCLSRDVINDNTATMLVEAIKDYKEKSTAFLSQFPLDNAPNNDIGIGRQINGYVIKAHSYVNNKSKGTEIVAKQWVNFCTLATDVLEAALQLNEPIETKCGIYKNEIELIDQALNFFPTGEPDGELRAKRSRAVSRLESLDPKYTVEEAPATNYKSAPGGCYVATAVYGSYDCPEVWTLRRYRDYTLAETWYGRMFVHVYYAISPTLVKWFGDTNWFKDMWRPTLDRMVIRLNNDGVADTPYQDRSW